MALILVATAGAINANSYCSLAEANVYHEAHLYASAWNDAESENQIAALVWATRLLDDYVDWAGYTMSLTQALRWPRSNVMDRDGMTYFDTLTIPTFLKRATAEFARCLLAEDRTAERGFGIKSVTADTVSVEFDKQDVKPIVPAVVSSMIVQYGRVSGPGRMTIPLVRV